MKAARYWVLLYLCTLLTLACCSDKVHNIFNKLSKIKNDLSFEAVNSRPPRHMMELYTDFVNGDRRDVATETTVRSMLPMIGESRWTSILSLPTNCVLLFNVSCVKSNEEVTIARLHLHRRKMVKNDYYHKRFLPPPSRVNIYQIRTHELAKDYDETMSDDTRTMSLASLPVTPTTNGGWQTLDITPVLRELLINSQGSTELLLGVSFQTPKVKITPVKHFLKKTGPYDRKDLYKSAAAFLVTFSEESADYDEEDNIEQPVTETSFNNTKLYKERHLLHKMLKMHTKNKDKKDRIKQNETIDKKDIRHKVKRKKALLKRAKADDLVKRRKNELKSLPFLHQNEVEEIRQTARRFVRSVDNNELPPLHNDDDELDDDNSLPSTTFDRKIESKYRRWFGNSTEKQEKEMCRRQRLRVIMAGLGGRNRIILPTVFEGHYCRGACSAPIDVNTSRPNYNILYEDKTAQCVADKTSSFTLLYYDQCSNVVVKHISDFTVDTCTCR